MTNGDLAIYWKLQNLSSRKRERAGEECHPWPPASNKKREKGFWQGPYEKGNKRSCKKRSGFNGRMKEKAAEKKE
jgi:hypothetical protein